MRIACMGFCAGLLALALLVTPAAGDAQTSQPEISGWGGLPLSDRLTALWLTGPRRTDKPQPVIMVYYRGAPGWHQRKWSVNARFGKFPAWIRLTSTELELAIEYGPSITVQGAAVDLSSATVFLVDFTAPERGEPVVRPLGVVVFAVPPDENPARHVLEKDPGIAATVLR